MMDNQSKNWQKFFKQESLHYLDNGFTQNTHAEVDFIVRELGARPGQQFLDIGCGTGRHSIELARRGYRCTGIDQSPDMLEVGKAIANEQGVEVEFIHGEASSTRLDRQFDHAICICEGAFCLMELGTNPILYHKAILDNIASMLKPGGMFLLTALNGFRLAREHSDADVINGHFDLMTNAYVDEMPIEGGGTVQVIEKGFFPGELKSLVEEAGFHVIGIWGGTAGSWNKASLSLDEIELMMLSKRS